MSGIRTARRDRGWSQARLIKALSDEAAKDGLRLPSPDSMRVMLSRWENAHVVPDETYRRYLCAALATDEGALGFVVCDGVELTLGIARTHESAAYLLAHLDRTLEELARADNALGSSAVLGAAEAEANMVGTMAKHVAGPHRAQFLVLASRFAEFCGWLRQDAGDFDRAKRWSDFALEIAEECGDTNQLSYVLMRKSNLSLETGEAPRAVGLAEAALRLGDSISPQVRAVALRARALGNASCGEERSCLAALEGAREELERVDAADDRTAYVSWSYIESEAGRCLIRLKEPKRAEAVLRGALDHWPADMQRDRAHCVARLSSALADLDQVEEATAVLGDAVAVAKKVSSERLRREIRGVGQGLVRRRGMASVGQVNDAILNMG